MSGMSGRDELRRDAFDSGGSWRATRRVRGSTGLVRTGVAGSRDARLTAVLAHKYPPASACECGRCHSLPSQSRDTRAHVVALSRRPRGGLVLFPGHGHRPRHALFSPRLHPPAESLIRSDKVSVLAFSDTKGTHVVALDSKLPGRWWNMTVRQVQLPHLVEYMSVVTDVLELLPTESAQQGSLRSALTLTDAFDSRNLSGPAFTGSPPPAPALLSGDINSPPVCWLDPIYCGKGCSCLLPACSPPSLTRRSPTMLRSVPPAFSPAEIGRMHSRGCQHHSILFAMSC